MKSGEYQNTVLDISDSKEDRSAITAAIEAAKKSPRDAVSAWVSIDVRLHLVGVSYIPRVNWFCVSVVDLRTILFGDYVLPLAVLIVLSTVLSLGALALTVNKIVLR